MFYSKNLGKVQNIHLLTWTFVFTKLREDHCKNDTMRVSPKGNFTPLQCWATKLSPSLSTVEWIFPFMGLLNDCVCVGRMDCLSLYIMCFMEVRVWTPQRLLHPLPHWQGGGNTELLWDQFERCFPSLLWQKNKTVYEFSEEAPIITEWTDYQLLYSAWPWRVNSVLTVKTVISDWSYDQLDGKIHT